MYRIILIVSGFFLSCFIQPAQAQIKHCQPVAVSGESMALTTKKPAFFLIQNTASSDVWLSHSSTDREGDMTIRIAPRQWSALILKQSNFTINCIESRPGHEQQLPCDSLLTVCQAEKIRIPSAEQNTHFMTNNVRRTLALWQTPLKKK